MSGSRRARQTGGRIHRRAFLRGVAALPVAFAPAGSRAEENRQAAGEAGPIVRVWRPENFEFPFASLNSFLTPNHLFYVRAHFGVYRGADLRAWRLKIEGRVERPLELTYDDLLKIPSRTQVALLECAGNSR